MNRPSLRARESATTILKKGRFLRPNRCKRIRTTIIRLFCCLVVVVFVLVGSCSRADCGGFGLLFGSTFGST